MCGCVPRQQLHLDELGVRPAAVFCTHGHFDHVGSASVFQDRYGAKVFLHAADVKTAKAANFLMMAYKIPAKLKLPNFTLLEGVEGETRVADVAVNHRLMPGHSAGSCFIEIGSTCFSGDTLYRSGVGLSNIPGEQPEVLRRSLRTVWDEIAPHTLVCPGHGRAATYAEIRRCNTELAAFMTSTDAEVTV